MRKTSKDTGDTMSVNSGVENDIRKADISSKKRNSIKKKVQSFGNESDDAALVPLLQTYKDKPEIAKQSAKYTLSKTKTDSINEEEEEEENIKIMHKDIEREALCKSVTSAYNMSEHASSDRSKVLDSVIVCNPAAINNNNSNVSSIVKVTSIASCTAKNTFRIDINEKTTSSFNASPLIFTTAKIHTDSKSKDIDPIQVTSVPILSTVIESNPVKSEVTPNTINKLCNATSNEGKLMMATDMIHKTRTQINKTHDTKVKSDQIFYEPAKKMLDKSSLNKLDDKEKDTSKTLSNTISTTLPSYSHTAGVYKENSIQVKNKMHDNNVNVKKDKDDTTTSSKIMNDPKKSPDVKLESTSSMKKLQRQKHTAIEESNNLTVSQTENKRTNIDNKNIEIEPNKTNDIPNVSLTNGSVQTDNLKKTVLSTVQTKVVKTSPKSCTSDNEKISTISTFATSPISKPVTTVKSITTGAIISNAENSRNTSSLAMSSKSTADYSKKTGEDNTKSSTTASTVKLISTSKDSNDFVTKSPTLVTLTTTSTSIKPLTLSSLPQNNPVSKIDTKLKSPPMSTKTTMMGSLSTINKSISVVSKDSEKSSSNGVNLKQSSLSSSSTYDVPVSTPLYIVSTSKTKIGGTPTSNTSGISKAQIDKSIPQVVSTVKTTPTAISKPDSNLTSAIDTKSNDAKSKPTTSKSSLRK